MLGPVLDVCLNGYNSPKEGTILYCFTIPLFNVHRTHLSSSVSVLYMAYNYVLWDHNIIHLV